MLIFAVLFIATTLWLVDPTGRRSNVDFATKCVCEESKPTNFSPPEPSKPTLSNGVDTLESIRTKQWQVPRIYPPPSTTLCKVKPPLHSTPHVNFEILPPQIAGIGNRSLMEAFCKPYVYARYNMTYFRKFKPLRHCDETEKTRDMGCEYMHACVWPSPQDPWISGRIINGEPWSLDEVTTALTHLQAYPQGLFVDVGSNIGVFSIPAAGMGINTFSIDALPAHAEMLAKTMSLNGLHDRHTMVRNAIGDTLQTATFFVDSGNKGASRLNENLPGWVTPERIIVDLVPLDSLLEYIAPRFKKSYFWKLDVEGNEARLLSGGWQLLSYLNPRFVSLEIMGGDYHGRITDCSLKNMLLALVNAGWRIPWWGDVSVVTEENVDRAVAITNSYGEWAAATVIERMT